MSNSLDQIISDTLSSLIWVETVCKSYQQTAQAGKDLKWVVQEGKNTRQSQATLVVK